MRLMNGPWLTLLLLTPLLVVISMAVLQVPAVDRAFASTPGDSNAAKPSNNGNGVSKTAWWGDSGRRSSGGKVTLAAGQSNSSGARANSKLSGGGSSIFDGENRSPSTSVANSRPQSNASDLFASFDRSASRRSSTNPQPDAIAAFERETASGYSDGLQNRLPANHQPSRQRVGFAHAGGLRDVAAVNESQFNTRVDPIAQSRAFQNHRNETSLAAVPEGRLLGAATQKLTWRGAITRLNQLGITEYRLEPGQRSHEFLFSCRYTPADSPRLTRLFMAEAVEPLRAVSKVISQVEQWKRLR